MANGNLTIYDPQQISVITEVYFPGQSVQGKLLAAGEQWQVSGPPSGQWVAFSAPETGEMLAAALLPAIPPSPRCCSIPGSPASCG